jgi:uncharacterized protein YndB with AHSA1/START domain
MTDSATNTRYPQTAIAADPTVPIIHLRRDFRATPAQLFRAHTDPEVFVRWIGPDAMTTRIDYWDARTGGSWRYLSHSNGQDHAFRGTFHTVDECRIVQTFTWEGLPDDVSLETMTFEDLGDGTTRMSIKSLCESFEARDSWLSSGMESGVNEGYAKIDALLAEGAL